MAKRREEIGWDASTLRVQERTLKRLRGLVHTQFLAVVLITSSLDGLCEAFWRYRSNALAPYWLQPEFLYRR